LSAAGHVWGTRCNCAAELSPKEHRFGRSSRGLDDTGDDGTDGGEFFVAVAHGSDVAQDFEFNGTVFGFFVVFGLSV